MTKMQQVIPRAERLIVALDLPTTAEARALVMLCCPPPPLVTLRRKGTTRDD